MVSQPQCLLDPKSIEEQLAQADQRLEKLKNSGDLKLFCRDGEIQNCLYDIEDGLWEGRKVAGWNTYFFLPYSVADDETLKALQATYRTWHKIYSDIDQELEELSNFYSTKTDCKAQQALVGSLLLQLELDTPRLTDFCITARTGIPSGAKVNGDAIRSLEL